MPKKLNKSIRVYLSKLKKLRSISLTNPPTTSSLLSACKYPKTPSFSVLDRRPRPADDAAATLSDVDRFLLENFQSLYLHDDSDDGGVARRRPPRGGAIGRSDRFFVSPSTSNSLAAEARSSSSLMIPSSSSSSSSSCEPAAVPGDSVAVMTLSKDPYEDFRRSMRDMIESRHADPRQPMDWDFMEELLLCYLELNDRSVHKHIMKAFTDLTVSFRRRFPAERRPVWRRRRRPKVGGELDYSSGSDATEDAAPAEKVKDCYYERRKHVDT